MLNHLLLLVIFCGWLILVPSPVAASGESGNEASGSPSRDREQGNGIPTGLEERWGKYRDRLERAGVQFWASYTADNLGNVSGGRATAFRYAGGLATGLALDLEKLLSLRGLVFKFSGEYSSGRDLSREVGGTLAPAQIYDGDTMRLYQLSLEQSFFDDRASFLAGRIGMGDEFFTSPLNADYVQGAFNGNHGSFSVNIPSFSVSPIATWGWRFRYENERTYVMTGVYYADDTLGEESKHGLDFSMRRDKGFISALQIGYKYHQEKQSQILPGKVEVGAFYDSNRYENLGSPTEGDYGNYGFYLHGEQMLFAEGGSAQGQGLTAFLGVSVFPRTELNTFPYFYEGGLVYEGLIPGRENDITALGVAYGQYSSKLAGTYETVFEVGHKFQITPWLGLHPDFQYILRPGGAGKIPDATVLGFELVISL